jgi:CheY-like chemotaxis protein
MKRLRILLGGVTPLFGDLRKTALDSWGFDIHSVADGKQACSALFAGQSDLCILDWDMPKMSGLQACHWIRSVSLKWQPYVILVTHKDQPEQVRDASWRARMILSPGRSRLRTCASSSQLSLTAFRKHTSCTRKSNPWTRWNNTGETWRFPPSFSGASEANLILERKTGHVRPRAFGYPLNPYSTSALRSFSRQRPRMKPMEPVASPSRCATSA